MITNMQHWVWLLISFVWFVLDSSGRKPLQYSVPLLISEGIICYNKKTPAMEKPVLVKQAGGNLLLML